MSRTPLPTPRSTTRARTTATTLVAIALLGAQAHAQAQVETMVTGGKTGTYFAIGNNLRDLVDSRIAVKDSAGSWSNVEEMSRTRGVSLAIVQSDVYDAFVQMRDDPAVPTATRDSYRQLLSNLRVFMPLYPEEVHVLVRKDEPIDYIHQIENKAIWMDLDKSGTYLTALNIYSRLFQRRPQQVPAFINPTATGPDEGTRRRRSALMALSDPTYYAAYPRIDVMVLVGGQPLSLLQEKVPNNLKLLKWDPSHPGSAALLRHYQRAEIQQIHYPALNITGSTSPTLAVNAYLITAQFADPQRNQFIQDLAGRMCQKWSVLQTQGHPKWASLSWSPGQPLPALASGWRYSSLVQAPLTQCRNGTLPTTAPSAPPSACRPQDRFAGLCD